MIDRIMIDPRLNANPYVDEAHHRVPPAGFKYLVTQTVCWATGGPQNYTGKSMAESHKDLKITGKEWEAFLDDFQQTLDKFKVPSEEQAELKAIVNSTRSDIVVTFVAVQSPPRHLIRLTANAFKSGVKRVRTFFHSHENDFGGWEQLGRARIKMRSRPAAFGSVMLFLGPCELSWRGPP